MNQPTLFLRLDGDGWRVLGKDEFGNIVTVPIGGPFMTMEDALRALSLHHPVEIKIVNPTRF